MSALWVRLIVFFFSILQNLLWVYLWIVIIAAVLTWIEPNPYNPIVRFLYSVTEPVFYWVREHIPVVFGGLDLSPILIIIAIELAQQVLLPTLEQLLLPGAGGMAFS